MLIGFIIWSIVALIFVGIGICARKAKEPVGFFTGVKPPVVKDVVKYNHAVSNLWFAYAILLEIFGLPLLFLKQNSPGFVLSILGTVAISIGLAIAYSFILAKNRA
ncbi:MAG: hypothetical protein K5739_08740 [Lachnospiraceae bacterium]|nr:hypothetical protein [Lachnospiraceae bacterium]